MFLSVMMKNENFMKGIKVCLGVRGNGICM